MKTVIAAALLALGLNSVAQAATTFLNVSYDPTREFYQEYNDLRLLSKPVFLVYDWRIHLVNYISLYHPGSNVFHL